MHFRIILEVKGIFIFRPVYIFCMASQQSQESKRLCVNHTSIKQQQQSKHSNIMDVTWACETENFMEALTEV